MAVVTKLTTAPFSHPTPPSCSQPCLAARAELLEGFHAMAKRDFVKRFVEKKTSEFYLLFNSEINTVKKLFDAVRRQPPKSPILPKYAGTAR